ncbi:MAG: nitroreductase family deazaflavin-dependent oxidoreductase [Actinomycetota bacterium]
MEATRRALALTRKVANPAVEVAIRAGLPPRAAHILTTRGRKSGEPRSTPVILVEREGTRYLVAPYGEVGWVHNVRAHGRVTLTRGRTSEELEAVEADPEEAAPVLRSYLRRWWPAVAPYFRVGPFASPESFAAEAPRHPVFRLRPPR